jgi:hypothetical protein
MAKHKYIETPEKMWELFEEFVEHETATPFEVKEWVGKDGNEVTKKLQVPILWEAFEVWLADKGLIQDLKDYASNKDDRYKEYAPIVTRIRNYIFANNLKGAAVGVFQQNIIARKLGLTDKKEIKAEVNAKPMFGNNPLGGE